MRATIKKHLLQNNSGILFKGYAGDGNKNIAEAMLLLSLFKLTFSLIGKFLMRELDRKKHC